MKKLNRTLRLVSVVGISHLLLACAQPTKPVFVSHFVDARDRPEFELITDVPGRSAQEAQEKSPANPPNEEQEAREILGTGKVIADPRPVPVLKAAPVKLAFEDAPLSQVVRTVMGDILALDYVLHPPITGTVTLNTQKAVPAHQALDLLETALQANGMGIVRDTRNIYHVGRIDALKALGGTVRQASKAGLSPGYGAIVVPLEYIGATEMANILKPMVPGDAILRVDTVRNLLVLSGTRAQAEGWLEMVRTFDVNLLEGMSVGVFPLKHVSIQEVNTALQLMAGGSAAAAAAPAAGSPRQSQAGGGQVDASGLGGASASNNAFFGALRLVPIERLNSVLVIAPRASYLEEAKRWLARLDQPGSGGAQAQLHIYQVQNGNAKHLATVLSGIFGGQQSGADVANSGVAPSLSSTTQGGQGRSAFANASTGSRMGNTGVPLGNARLGQTQSAFGNANANSEVGTSNFSAQLGNIRVMADELNNSVLIWGTLAEYERIEQALKRLDVPPTQVLIEASIVEVTLNDTLKYGLQWAFSTNDGGYQGSGSLLSGSGSGLLDAATAGFSYSIKNSAGAVRAAMNALANKTNVKVVASPSLMVLDNHTAMISVGTQQPYQAGSTYSGTDANVITSNIQYKDTGVNLQVTPSVNAGNIVTMNIAQGVTDVGAIDEATGQRSFLQREVSSRVAVRSGESIVMGGLIQENQNSGKAGIPVLHNLPVVGNLFGTTTVEGARTELIVVITPRVVRTDVDVREVTESLKAHMQGLQGLLQPVTGDPTSMEKF